MRQSGIPIATPHSSDRSTHRNAFIPLTVRLFESLALIAGHLPVNGYEKEPCWGFPTNRACKVDSSEFLVLGKFLA